jgi:urea transport system permease protein
MRNFCARLAALVAAMCLLAIGGMPARAQSYEQALAGFAADSFSDTDTAITGVAGSGHPLAAKVI